MKKFIAGLLVALLVISLAAPVAEAKDKNDFKHEFKHEVKSWFKDIGKDYDWARFFIEKMFAKRVIVGYPGGLFKPGNPVSHLEAIIMALRIMGWEDEIDWNKELPKDIKRFKVWNAGYYYIAKAVEKGIVKADELWNFDPNKPAKRYEVARYIVRAIGKEEEAQKHMDEKLPFRDAKAIPKNAVGYVYVVKELGLMIGYPDNTFRPNAPVSRAEMAKIICQLDEFQEEDKDKETLAVVVSVDEENMTITVKENGKVNTYDLEEGTPVYIDKNYGDIDQIAPGDEVKLIFNDGKVVFIQVVGKEVTTKAKGIVVDVNEEKQTVTLFTYSGQGKGYVGILEESDIEGRHFELETEYDRLVLVGDTDGLEDYVGKKIVVMGEVKDEASIYMRGPLLEVDEWFEVTEKNTLTFSVTSETWIEMDGKRTRLANIKEGAYVELTAQKDTAISIKVIE